MLEPWRQVWREGFRPLLSDATIAALKTALETDDSRIIQGRTITPPPMMLTENWPVEGACAIGFCGLSEGLTTVGEVEEFFARLCFMADQRLGQPSGCRWFLNWFDETPRDVMRRELLKELS